MKPLLIFLAWLCSLCGVHSQGVVNFRNENLPAPPDRLVRLDGCPTVGTTFAVQLLYGTDSASLTPHPVLAYFRASLSPGTWSGGNRTLTGIALPATPLPGTTTFGPQVWMQIRAWDAGTGRTIPWDQARAGGVWGQSDFFTYVQRSSDPPDVFDTAMLNFQGFQALSGSCVPEPAVASLLLSAIAVVWLMKRRTNI